MMTTNEPRQWFVVYVIVPQSAALTGVVSSLMMNAPLLVKRKTMRLKNEQVFMCEYAICVFVGRCLALCLCDEDTTFLKATKTMQPCKQF